VKTMMYDLYKIKEKFGWLVFLFHASNIVVNATLVENKYNAVGKIIIWFRKGNSMIKYFN
jgi:hypothetical protein